MRALVVTMPEAECCIGRILQTKELWFVSSVATAFACFAARRFDVALVSVAIPDAFDVVRAIAKERPDLSVVCIRSVRGGVPLSRTTLKGLDVAARAAGGRGFVDFFDYPDDESGATRIRAAISALLSD